MVLLYSLLLSRRIVGRPGSRARPQSTLMATESIQAMTALRCSSVGCGLPLGGMFLCSTFSLTSSHRSRAFLALVESLYDSRLRPADTFLSLWQPRQYWVRIGRIESAKTSLPGGAGTGAAGVGAARSSPADGRRVSQTRAGAANRTGATARMARRDRVMNDSGGWGARLNPRQGLE